MQGLERSLTSGPSRRPQFLLRNDLLQPFLPGIFPVCEEVHLEKILYFIIIFGTVFFFFFFIRSKQACMDARWTLSAKEQFPLVNNHDILLFGSFKDNREFRA